MLCERCGKENKSENKFCIHCGAELVEPIDSTFSSVFEADSPKTPEVIEHTCPNCHNKVNVEDKFCICCGKKLEQDEYLGKKCPTCGKINSASSKYCIDCGTIITSIKEETPKKSKANIALVLSIVSCSLSVLSLLSRIIISSTPVIVCAILGIIFGAKSIKTDKKKAIISLILSILSITIVIGLIAINVVDIIDEMEDIFNNGELPDISLFRIIMK